MYGDLVAVVADQADGREVGLPEDLRGGALLAAGRAGRRDRRRRIWLCRAARFMIWWPMRSKRSMNSFSRSRRASSLSNATWREVDRLGPMPAKPTITRGRVVTLCDVAADAAWSSRRRRRARRPSRPASRRVGDLLVAPAEKRSSLLHAPGGGRASRRACGSTGAWRAPSPCRRGGDGVAGLVDRRRRASPRRRSRSCWAVPDSIVVIASTMSVHSNSGAPVGVRVGQRHRADLLDHRRGVAVGDPRQLVAALGRVEVGDRGRPCSR